MEKLELIKEQIQPILAEFNVELYDINWHKAKKSSTLEVAIMQEDGSMDLDTCAGVSEKISEVLDSLDCIEEEYYLEVCSPGAERVLRNQKEVKNAQGKKVFVQLKNEVKGMKEVVGILETFMEGQIKISYKEKTANRSLETSYENIDFIRLAV